MPTLIKKKIKKSRAREIQNATDYYMRKYYNMFMHQWTVEGLDYQQEYFFTRGNSKNHIRAYHFSEIPTCLFGSLYS